MTKDVWINLPVKNVQQTKTFFSEIGFSFKSEFEKQNVSAAMLIGEKNTVIMFFEESVFKGFVQSETTDAKTGSEVLISFDAESEKEVDEMAEKVIKAGGTVFGSPSAINGWMYGMGFADPDGHRWNMLYLDFSKIPGKNYQSGQSY